MRIVELTNFTAGVCGVATRVKQESSLFAKRGHRVIIISSDFIKGSKGRAPPTEKMGKVTIYRVHAKKLGGESFMRWDWKTAKEIISSFKPDAIVAHAYRHLHTLFALKLGRTLNIPVFLVTHAPFVKANETRSFLAKLAVLWYDSPLGLSKRAQRFTKVIAITKWELPFLKKLGLPSKNITYLPNGLSVTYFSQKKSKEDPTKILFLGRIAPIKSLETLIEAASLMKSNSFKIELVGPKEEAYYDKLSRLIEKKNLGKKVIFSKPLFNQTEKIRKIDSAKIFVLPSLREAMPQALIEAMAREKVVVASDNPGTRDIIQNKVNGYLFKAKDSKSLASLLDALLANKKKNVSRKARESVLQFQWQGIMNSFEKMLIRELKKNKNPSSTSHYARIEKA